MSRFDDAAFLKKEREWRDALDARFHETTAALKCRDEEVTLLKAEREVLEQDFKYNLGLLAGRDAELDRYEAKIDSLNADLLEKTEKLSNVRLKLEDAELSLRRKRLENEDARQLYEKTVVEKDTIIKDLKSQLETGSKKWVEQLESERATYRRQLMKLDSDAQIRSEGIEQKFAYIIDRKDLHHKAEMDKISAGLLQEQNQRKQMEQELHGCQTHIVKLEKSLTEAQNELKERCENYKCQEQKLQTSLQDLENENSVTAAKLKETEAELAEKETEIKIIRLRINPVDVRKKPEEDIATDNERCNQSITLEGALTAQGDAMNYPALSHTETNAETQLKQQNFVMRQVIKDMKRQITDSQSKAIPEFVPTIPAYRSSEQTVCKECTHMTKVLRCERREMEKEITQLKAKVDAMSCEECDSEDEKRVEKLEDAIGFLKIQMLQGIRDKMRGHEYEGNESEVSYDDVRMMLLEEKLDRATENIGKAVATENKELLNEMLNMKMELVAILEEAKRRSSEENRKCGKTDRLASEEMLAKVRDEIIRLESKIEETRNPRHASQRVEERNCIPQLIPERLNATSHVTLDGVQKDPTIDRNYPDVPDFMTDPGLESRQARMRPVVSQKVILNPRNNCMNIKYTPAIPKPRVTKLKVRNYNIKDDG